jgi:hypothetical protein
MAMLDVNALQMGDVVSSGKGAKSVNLTQDGSQALFTLEPMEIAYEPSAFQDQESTRVNIVFRPTPEVEEFLDSIDEWVMREVAVNSVKLARSVDSLKDSYTPILKKSDKWPSQFKAKMNLQEPSKVKIWDADACLREAPQTWQGCVARPKLRLKSIYLMGTSFGPVLECTDIQIIQEASAGSSCPF